MDEKIVVNEKTIMLLKTLRNAKGRMKTKELCEILGIKPRMLLKHRRYLEMLGYKFDVTFGNVNGGYLLVEESFSAEELAEIQNCIRPDLFEKLERIINRV